MARMYEYGTSPRKLNPDYDYINDKRARERAKEEKQKKELEAKKQKRLELKQAKRKNYKNIAVIISMFLLLLAVSYRNSLITEKFKEIQNKKQELSAIQKNNEQTEVSIESSLNLKNLEETAKNELGMQKLNNDQKVYVTLPKEDYTESAVEDIQEEDNSNWFQNLIEKLFK